MPDKGRVTLHDVARRCHASIATVSRIVNDANYPVSPEMRERVLKAVQELNYQPNMLGRYLKFNQSSEIGVLIPHISHYYYTELVAGINDTLVHSGYTVLLCDSYRNTGYEKKQFLYLLQKQVRGIIIAPVDSTPDWGRSLSLGGTHLVSVEQPFSDAAHFVGVDDYRGGRLAAQHLLQKGHRRLAFISPPLDTPRYRQRYQGFADELCDAGVPLLPAYTRTSDSGRDIENVYEFDIGLRLTENLLMLPKPPTAIACVSDLTAMGALQCLQNRGLHVPRDMAVLGFDNLPLSSMVMPPLTTVDQRIRDMGARAADLLLQSFERTHPVMQSVTLESRLIERASTESCAFPGGQHSVR